MDSIKMNKPAKHEILALSVPMARNSPTFARPVHGQLDRLSDNAGIQIFFIKPKIIKVWLTK